MHIDALGGRRVKSFLGDERQGTRMRFQAKISALKGASVCGDSKCRNVFGRGQEIAWKAKHRLHKRYMKLGAAGKDQRKIVTAVARELLGFIWAIGTRAETLANQQAAA